MVAREKEITFSQSRNVRKDASDQENPYFDASCIFVAVTCMTGALTEV